MRAWKQGYIAGIKRESESPDYIRQFSVNPPDKVSPIIGVAVFDGGSGSGVLGS